MVDAGISFTVGVLIGGLQPHGWDGACCGSSWAGSAWHGETSGWPIFISSISSTAIAGGVVAVVFWAVDARTTEQPGVARRPGRDSTGPCLRRQPFAWKTDRRIGPAFVQGAA